MGSQISSSVLLFRRRQELHAGGPRAPSLQLLTSRFRIPTLFYLSLLALLVVAVLPWRPIPHPGLPRTLPEKFGFIPVVPGEFVPSSFTTDDRVVRVDYHSSPDTVTLVVSSRLVADIDVDVNQNGAVDQGIDVSFNVDSSRHVCKSYMRSMNGYTLCNIFDFAAAVRVGHDGDVNVLAWTIPLKELTSSRDSISFQIVTWDASNQRSTRYPGPTFRTVYRIALKDQIK